MSSGDRPEVSERAAALEDASLGQLLGAIERGPFPTSSDAIQEIIRRFQPVVLAFWHKHACGEYDDFLQDVMVRLFGALPSLRDHAAFPGFFRRIVIATAADYWRKQGPHERLLVDVDVEELESSFDQDLTVPLIVRSLLDQLPPREREVVEMSFLEDLDTREIARLTGLTPGAVRVTKSRAINRLRTIMSREAER